MFENKIRGSYGLDVFFLQTKRKASRKVQKQNVYTLRTMEYSLYKYGVPEHTRFRRRTFLNLNDKIQTIFGSFPVELHTCRRIVPEQALNAVIDRNGDIF